MKVLHSNVNGRSHIKVDSAARVSFLRINEKNDQLRGEHTLPPPQTRRPLLSRVAGRRVPLFRIISGSDKKNTCLFSCEFLQNRAGARSPP